MMLLTTIHWPLLHNLYCHNNTLYCGSSKICHWAIIYVHHVSKKQAQLFLL